MENKFWKKTVGGLIGAIWLYTLADIAGGITEAVDDLLDPGGVLGMFASVMGSGGEESPFGIGDLLEWFFPLLVLFGYLLFYGSLSRFMRLQRSDADREAVGKVRTSYILLLVAVLVDFIPVIGWLAALVLTIIGYAKMLSGYKGMRNSATYTEEARRGAAGLHSATVWLIVGYIIGCIPFCGFIESLIAFIVFFCILSGWGRIRNGAPALTEAEAADLEREEQLAAPRKSTIPVWWFPTYIGLYLFSSAIYFSLQLRGWLTDRFTFISQQELDPEMFGELSIGDIISSVSLLIGLAIIGLCIFLIFSKNARLSRMARLGVLLLIVSVAISRILPFFYHLMPEEFFGMVLQCVNLFIGCVGIAGMMLFVWSTTCNLTTKITLTVYEILGLVGGYILYKVWWSLSQNLYGDVDSWDVCTNFSSLCSSAYYLAFNVLCFIAVLIGAICWHRKQKCDYSAA